MHRRASASAVVVVVILVVVTVVGYFVWARQPAQPEGSNQPTESSDNTVRDEEDDSKPDTAVDETSIKYENTEYNFNFTLPASWEGYSIVTDSWEGVPTESAGGDATVEKGVTISIRHPEWTQENVWQDIPIMVFTLEQWTAMQEGKLSVGAAPVLPSELGRNAKYVFVLPARYNYAFPTGYEEVEEILQGNPLEAF